MPSSSRFEPRREWWILLGKFTKYQMESLQLCHACCLNVVSLLELLWGDQDHTRGISSLTPHITSWVISFAHSSNSTVSRRSSQPSCAYHSNAAVSKPAVAERCELYTLYMSRTLVVGAKKNFPVETWRCWCERALHVFMRFGECVLYCCAMMHAYT